MERYPFNRQGSILQTDESEGPKQLSLKAAYRFGIEHGLEKEVSEIRDMEIEWDRSITSSLRRGYIVRLFRSKGIFDEFQQKYWPLFSTRQGQTKSKWYLKNADDYDRFLRGEDRLSSSQEIESEAAEESEFAYETDLRDFLAQHLEKLGEGLIIYKDGVEYPVENGRIDILAAGLNGDFLVVELKVSQGRSKTLGQLLYYMGWVERNLAQGKKVRGTIVAKKIPDDLKLACSRVSDFSLYEYDLQVSLRSIPLS
jgi:hypothetical protein